MFINTLKTKKKTAVIGDTGKIDELEEVPNIEDLTKQVEFYMVGWHHTSSKKIVKLETKSSIKLLPHVV